MRTPYQLKAFIYLILLWPLSTLVLHGETTSPAKQDAVSALEEDVKASPQNPELWLHLGFAYRKVGQVDQSQSAFEKTLALDPNSREALYMLGLLYEKKNLKQQAEGVWKRYLNSETNPEKRAEAEKHLHHLSQ